MRRHYQPATLAASKDTTPEHHCRDCGNMYDPHSLDYKGDPILCRCHYYHDGKISKFLKDPACEKHFIKK